MTYAEFRNEQCAYRIVTEKNLIRIRKVGQNYGRRNEKQV
jgi:hypothetical protein